MSSEIGELAKALCAAQGDFKPVPKSGLNPHFKSHFSTLSDIIDSTQDALKKNGLSVVQLPSGGGEGNICLMTFILHSSGQYIAGEFILPVKNNTAQECGSSMSYARRYARAAVLGLASEDDDGNAASTQKPTTYQQAIHTKPTVHSPSDEPVDHEYRVGFGKFKGSRLNDIKNTDLVGYLDYLTKTSEQTGKEPSKFAKDFMEKAYAYLNAQTGLPKEDDKHFRSFDNIPPPDDDSIPF